MTVRHVAIAGPIACEELRGLLHDPAQQLPPGYPGAPLTSVLIRELIGLGVRVTAVTTSVEGVTAADVFRAEGNNLSLRVVPSRRRAWRPNGWYPGRAIDFFAQERKLLARVLASSGAEVIHAHWTYEFALASQQAGIPALVTCHDAPQVILGYSRSPYRVVRYLMAIRALRAAKRLTAVSPYMCEKVQRYTATPIHCVPNPVAPYVIQAAGARKHPPTRRIAMVCNGWGKLKNPLVALRAFAVFRSKVREAELHLFGQGFGQGDAGYRRIRSLGLEGGVTFHGAMRHAALIDTLQTMDVLLHPALDESFSVVVAEAMALGLPVVAGKSSGAVPWVMGEGEGSAAASLLCDMTDPRAAAKMLGSAFDADYPKRSEAGVRRARHRFEPRAVAMQYLVHYDALRTREVPSDA